MSLYYTAENLNYTSSNLDKNYNKKDSEPVIKRVSPKNLSDASLTNFFNSLENCAGKSLASLGLIRFNITSVSLAELFGNLICEHARKLQTLHLRRMFSKQKF